MKYWFGHPVYECQCGYTTPDEKDFQKHLSNEGHTAKIERKKAVKPEAPKPEEKGE